MDQEFTECWIVGVLDSGLDSLTPTARQLLEKADLLLGDPRFLQLFAPLFAPHSESRSFAGRLKELPGWVESACCRGQRVVVLATGDPLLAGIAGYLQHKLAEGMCRILPTLSTPQLAFARLGLPWATARIISVHAQDGGEWAAAPGPQHPLYPLYQALPTADTLALLTSPANSPARIARLLLHLGRGEHYTMVVAERLDSPQERLHKNLSPTQVATTDFSHPNVVILLRNQEFAIPAPSALLGLPDADFLPKGEQTRLITKREVRVIVLANLALRANSIVWDIGAGSGSVGLEAARLLPQGWVYGVEKEANRCHHIQQTAARLGITNYQVLNGHAPLGLEDWPDPDGVFIGGSDGRLPELMHRVMQRLRPAGRLVITLATLENLSHALATIQRLDCAWEMTQIQLSHAQPILALHRLVAAAPVWVITVRRG